MQVFQDAVDSVQVLRVDVVTRESWISMGPFMGVIRLNT